MRSSHSFRRARHALSPLIAACLGLLLVPALAGCDFAPDAAPSRAKASARPAPEIPVVNLPRSLREWNWGGGSCVHASTVMHLRWQNAMDVADYWRKTYSGGESYNGLTGKLDRNKVPYYATAGGGGQDVAGQARDFAAFCSPRGGSYGTLAGDVDVLERCSAERRGGVIFYKPNHSILFCGFTPDGRDAIVLDNNAIEKFEVVEKQKFIRAWRGYGGVCVVPTIGWPRPPIPWIAAR